MIREPERWQHKDAAAVSEDRGWWSQGRECGQLLEDRKRKEMGSLLELLERIAALPTP